MNCWDLPAALVEPELTRELSVLLSRAYTDARHVANYTPEERAFWDRDMRRVHTGANEAMPPEWLSRFPTIRNLRRQPEARHASRHFFARWEGTLASHVALFPQRFEHATGVWYGGFIEDVATDPAMLGRGCASALLVAAAEAARQSGMPVLGLGTAIPEFYERLGWRRWNGPAAFARSDGHIRPDPGLMIHAIAVEGGPLLRNEGEAITTFRL